MADLGHRISKMTSDTIITYLAGSGSAGNVDGVGTNAKFNGPYGIAVDSAGNMYVDDNGNQRIRKITP